MRDLDVLIIGAGAAGLMCAIEAAKRGRRTLVIDHAKKPAEKIRISGGGRCNFTNLHAGPNNFLSDNAHFCKSALARYTQHDFISLVNKHRIPWHEKSLGQLFCDESSRQIIDLLLAEAPTTRGFAAILSAGLDGQSAEDILAVPDDFYSDLGLAALISPLRLRGMSAMLARIKKRLQ